MTKPKHLLHGSFLFLSLILLIALLRLNRHLRTSLNENMTVVAITVIVIILLALFFLGVLFAWIMDWAAHKNFWLFRQMAKVHLCQLAFPAFAERVREVEFVQPENSAGQDGEIIEAMKSPKRKGRKSNYSYQKRRKAVLAWERRGPNFSYTLVEFLDEHFGATSTGMPNVPATTFYDWRKEILAEAKDHQKAIKKTR
jgi:hypothetical protein